MKETKEIMVKVTKKIPVHKQFLQMNPKTYYSF